MIFNDPIFNISYTDVYEEIRAIVSEKSDHMYEIGGFEKAGISKEEMAKAVDDWFAMANPTTYELASPDSALLPKQRAAIMDLLMISREDENDPESDNLIKLLSLYTRLSISCQRINSTASEAGIDFPDAFYLMMHIANWILKDASYEVAKAFVDLDIVGACYKYNTDESEADKEPLGLVFLAIESILDMKSIANFTFEEKDFADLAAFSDALIQVTDKLYKNLPSGIVLPPEAIGPAIRYTFGLTK